MHLHAQRAGGSQHSRRTETNLPSVLLIDDDLDCRDIYPGVLRHFGFECSCANSAAAAFEYLAGPKPDVILLDLALPDIDGVKVLRRLRADETTAHIIVIVISAGDLPQHEAEVMALGAYSATAKPILASDLVAEIRSAIDTHAP